MKFSNITNKRIYNFTVAIVNGSCMCWLHKVAGCFRNVVLVFLIQVKVEKILVNIADTIIHRFRVSCAISPKAEGT